MSLFKRRPRLRWRAGVPEAVVPPEAYERYPSLRPDLEVADEEVLATFREINAAALQAQNRHRLARVTLIAATALATVLGATQAAVATARWPGIAEAVVAAAAAAMAFKARESGAHDEYLSRRTQAERLRSEYFQFIGRAGAYAGVASPRLVLRQRVAAIATGQEPA